VLVYRTMLDALGSGLPFQVGVALYVDGERRAEAWEDVRHHDSVAEAVAAARDAAELLADGQYPGQLRLM